MQESVDRNGLRWKIGTWLVYAGLVAIVVCLFDSVHMVERVSQAGSMMSFAGVARWQDSVRVVVFGFTLPFGCALLMAGSALRNSNASVRLVAGAPLVLFAAVLFIGVFLWFPKVTLFFGVGGTINAIGICITLYFCTKGIQPENPWAGLLRGLGFLTFANTCWFTCGLMSSPGAGALYPGFERNWGVVADLATKTQLCWGVGWAITALSFVLERQAAAQRSPDSTTLSGMAPVALTGATTRPGEAQAGAE